MSMVRTCDMCGASVTSDELPESAVIVDGRTIIQYDDMCDACRDRFESNAEKYLGTVKRQRRATTKEEK